MSNQPTIETKPAPAHVAGMRSITDIINDLSKPVMARHIKTKPQGGKPVPYISWYDRVKYLDHFAPGWSSEIVRMESIGGNLLIVVRISIPTPQGIVYREAAAQENEELESYGTASSNAEAQAFSRASAKFGLGLYLYGNK